VCNNQVRDGSQVVDSKDGEMSEWLKEHAWKLLTVGDGVLQISITVADSES
jgi:hypothetical protein